MTFFFKICFILLLYMDSTLPAFRDKASTDCAVWAPWSAWPTPFWRRRWPWTRWPESSGVAELVIEWQRSSVWFHGRRSCPVSNFLQVTKIYINIWPIFLLHALMDTCHKTQIFLAVIGWFWEPRTQLPKIAYHGRTNLYLVEGVHPCKVSWLVELTLH